MKVLVFIEHEGSEVRDATLSAVTAAAKLGEVHGLVVGTNVTPVAEAAEYKVEYRRLGTTTTFLGSMPSSCSRPAKAR